MLNTASIAGFAESFRGELITLTDSRYEQARKLLFQVNQDIPPALTA